MYILEAGRDCPALFVGGGGVGGYFTSEDAKAYKPRKELFQLALNKTRLNSNEVIHIGDSISSDVNGASALSIKTLWINRFGKEVPSGVESISNLLEAIDSI